MQWPELEPNPYLDFRQGPGDVRVRGTRVQFEIVVRAYVEGYAPEMIVANYPSLSLEAVHGVIAYYLGHEEAVERYMAAVLEDARARRREYEAKPKAPIVERMMRLREAKKSA